METLREVDTTSNRVTCILSDIAINIHDCIYKLLHISLFVRVHCLQLLQKELIKKL